MKWHMGHVWKLTMMSFFNFWSRHKKRWFLNKLYHHWKHWSSPYSPDWRYVREHLWGYYRKDISGSLAATSSLLFLCSKYLCTFNGKYNPYWEYYRSWLCLESIEKLNVWYILLYPSKILPYFCYVIPSHNSGDPVVQTVPDVEWNAYTAWNASKDEKFI